MIGFIINYNKLYVLKRCLNSLKEVCSKIYIIDNASDYIPLLNFYKSIENSNIKIIYNSKITDPDDLDSLGYYINKYKDDEFYLVTDSDIELLYPELAINAYKTLFKHYPDVNCIGPQLKIDNIPDNYPAKSFVLQIHQYFYNQKPCCINNIYFLFKRIDTTLAIYRTDKKWERLDDNSIRVFYPFNAIHLDWYITPNNMTIDQKYYLKHNKNNKTSHWSGSWYDKSYLFFNGVNIWEVKGSLTNYKPVRLYLK